MQKQSPELRAINFVTTLLRDGHGVYEVIDIIATAAQLAGCLLDDDTGYQLVLLHYGPKKIDLIKAIRNQCSGLGLKEAKDVSETPNIVLAQGTRAEIETLARELSITGCKLFVEKQKTIPYHLGQLKWVC